MIPARTKGRPDAGAGMFTRLPDVMVPEGGGRRPTKLGVVPLSNDGRDRNNSQVSQRQSQMDGVFTFDMLGSALVSLGELQQLIPYILRRHAPCGLPNNFGIGAILDGSRL